MALQPGMVVADIGAGTGYLSRRMAPLVMPCGKFIALDLQPEMVNFLQTGVKRLGLSQIEVKLSAVDILNYLRTQSIWPLWSMCITNWPTPYEVMLSITQALKPRGHIVFVEYKAEDTPVPIKPLHKMSEAQIKREAGIFALEWERTVSTLP